MEGVASVGLVCPVKVTHKPRFSPTLTRSSSSSSVKVMSISLDQEEKTFTLHKSQQAFEAAKELMHGGVNSPVRAFKSIGGQPIVISSVKGSHMWDIDENEYIDYVGSWRPAIIGYADDEDVTEGYVRNSPRSRDYYVTRVGATLGAEDPGPSNHERLVLLSYNDGSPSYPRTKIMRDASIQYSLENDLFSSIYFLSLC